MTPHLTPTITLILALIVITFGYGVACWIWPFKPCRRCNGSGRRRSPTGRAIRLCRRCRGTGLRLRAGRWIANHLMRIGRDAR